MSKRRTLVTVAGLALASLGVLFVLRPGLAFELSSSDVQLFIVGAVALLQAIGVIVDGRKTPITGAETPDPELSRSMAQAGDDFDETLAGTRGRRRSHRYNKENVHDRLYDDALAVLTWRHDYSEAEAREHLDAGTWTDDPYAAAFLGSGRVSDVPWRDRLRHTFDEETRFQRRARHAVDAVARLAGTEDDG